MEIVPMPVSEVADRLTIAMLKMHRLPDSEINKEDLQKQINYYQKGLTPDLTELCDNLYTVNGKIWDAEHEIRKGVDTLDLQEVGRRALEIRDLNRIRVGYKNQIAELAGQSEFKDCKMNHASAITQKPDLPHHCP